MVFPQICNFIIFLNTPQIYHQPPQITQIEPEESENYIDNSSNEQIDEPDPVSVYSGNNNEDTFYDGFGGGATTEMLEFATYQPTTTTVESTTIPTSEYK